MKKMLVSDYDQTFYTNDIDIEKNKIAVDKFRKDGNIFVIATGRSYQDFKNKLNEYNFSYDYVILNHGATILDRNDNILKNYSIDNNIIMDIKSNLELEKSILNFCCSKFESRVDYNHLNLTKIAVKYNTKEEAIKINNIINNKFSNFVNAYYVTKNSVEIISNMTSKSKAIASLLEILNIHKDSVYTIGDGQSDIDMIKDYNGYAMKDAVDELSKEAIGEYTSVFELIVEVLNYGSK